MIKFLAKRRFNCIDIIMISILMPLAVTFHYFWWVAVLAAGLTISALVEVKAGMHK